MDMNQKRAEAEAAARKERVGRFLMFRRVFAGPEGQRVLELLEKLTHDRVRPIEGGPIDPLQLAVIHGRREVVQFIRDQIAAGEREGTDA
jgi:hypothetical protein